MLGFFMKSPGQFSETPFQSTGNSKFVCWCLSAGRQIPAIAHVSTQHTTKVV